MKASSPTENIAVKPEDVISVPKANLVYVMGSVHKPGGFELGENESLSTAPSPLAGRGPRSHRCPAERKDYARHSRKLQPH
jgi:hypothetical protein